MNKRIYFIVRRAFHAMQDEDYDTEYAWENIKTRCGGKTRVLLKMRLLKYAAVVILILSLSICVQSLWQGEKLPQEIALIEEPCSKVELILANGEHFYLEDTLRTFRVESLGVKITKDSFNNVLHYRTDSSKKEIVPTEFNQLIIPKGGEYSLKLSDGSTVWLNAESSLKFPVQFASDSREVYLEGEAFFEIEKNEHSPFSVYTGDRKVTVLGTRFNVSAYPEDPVWQVTLVQGKVAVRVGEDEEILEPSEQYVLHNNTNKREVRTVDTEFYTSWISGKFYFKGYRFEDIVKKMERWYDFQMFYEQEEIKDMYFRGVIYKHRPLEETLRYLESTTDIEFHINDKAITVKKRENKKE